ncbi:MAG: sulfurtransferase TusA family protein [bacterium]|jgi:TusA-related sulfurtransferase
MMTTISRQTVELDLRGQVCPASLLISLKKMNSMREELTTGAVALRVLTSNRESVPTITDAARSMGYAVTVEHTAEHYVLTVESAGEGDAR